MTEQRRALISPFIAISIAAMLGAGCVYRHEAVIPLLSALGVALWFTAVPGIALVLLCSSKQVSRLRLILVGQLVGLTTMPLVYQLLLALNSWQLYGVVQSAINIVLILALLARWKNLKSQDLMRSLSATTLRPIFILLLVVTGIIVVKYFTQMMPDNLVIKTTEDIDAGMLMGIVVGIKNYGYCVNLHESGAALSYHYFVYLYMALVGTYSGATTLSIYHIVFPLYLFSLLALACFNFTRTLSGNNRVALMAGILILLVDDLSVINKVLSVLPGMAQKAYVYSIRVVGNLHVSPSWLCSIVMSFMIGTEVLNVQRRETSWFFMLALICASGILMGYKSPTFVCMVGGMSLMSLPYLKRRPQYFFLSLLCGIAGVLVLLMTIGATSTSNSMGISIGYPVLRSDIVRDVFGLDNRIMRLSMLDVRTILIIVGLFPVWLFSIYGVRLQWMGRAIRNLRALFVGDNYVELSVLLATVLGIGISMVFITEGAPFNIYYFAMYGLFASLPFCVYALYNRLAQKERPLVKYGLIALLLVHCFTGIQYMVKPLATREVEAVLTKEWMGGMQYLRDSTAKDCRLVSNRFDLNRKRPESTERFFFVPAFSERAVLASGRQYYGTPNQEYLTRRALVDSLLGATDPTMARRIASELKADYMVFDKWANESPACIDPTFVQLVFKNAQLEIYKIRS